MKAPLIENAVLAMAQTPVDPKTGQSAGGGLGTPILMLLFFGLFYFLMIRPQMRAKKEQDKMVSALKSGDDVVTSSGILGTVTNVKDKTVTLRIADGVKVEILKSAVTTVTKVSGTVEKAL